MSSIVVVVHLVFEATEGNSQSRFHCVSGGMCGLILNYYCSDMTHATDAGNDTRNQKDVKRGIECYIKW